MSTKWSKRLAVRPERMVDIQTLFSFIRTRGLKYSKKRAVVIEYFVNADRHFTVDELYIELKNKHHLGYSTVYRALKLLVDSGIATIHHFGKEDMRFELVHREEHHDHFVCRRCGKIFEFSDDGIIRLQEEVASRHGFRVDDHELQLFGVCKKCRQQSTRGRR